MPQKRDLNERLAFLNFTGEDEQCLGALKPVFERHAERLVQAFYRHLLSFRETRALLADPVVRDRLLSRQREYLVSLAGTKIDESYIVGRRRIGETHERVGLGPGWYLGAYSLYFSLLLPVISETYRGNSARSERAAAALMKVLMLDAELAMEAYMESREVELEHLNRELAAMGRDLQREYKEQSSELRETTQRARATGTPHRRSSVQGRNQPRCRGEGRRCLITRFLKHNSRQYLRSWWDGMVKMDLGVWETAAFRACSLSPLWFLLIH